MNCDYCYNWEALKFDVFVSVEVLERTNQQVLVDNVELEQKLTEEQSRRQALEHQLNRAHEQLQLQAESVKLKEV